MRIAMGVESLRMSLDCRRIGAGPARAPRNPRLSVTDTPGLTPV